MRVNRRVMLATNQAVLAMIIVLLGLLVPITSAWTMPRAVSRTTTRLWQAHSSDSMKEENPCDIGSDESPFSVSSRQPRRLNDRATFLGFRNTKDLAPQTRAALLGRSSSSTKLQSSSDAALMPDGGLSPCVIRVMGVGGGGCNAVSGNKLEELFVSWQRLM